MINISISLSLNKHGRPCCLQSPVINIECTQKCTESQARRRLHHPTDEDVLLQHATPGEVTEFLLPCCSYTRVNNKMSALDIFTLYRKAMNILTSEAAFASVLRATVVWHVSPAPSSSPWHWTPREEVCILLVSSSTRSVTTVGQSQTGVLTERSAAADGWRAKGGGGGLWTDGRQGLKVSLSSASVTNSCKVKELALYKFSKLSSVLCS